MPSIHLLSSCNRRFRLWLVAALLCCLSVADFGYQAHIGERGETARAESVAPGEGLNRQMLLGLQTMPAGIAVSAKNGERIGSSRPVRLTPTHGGKPGRVLGRWTSDNSIHLSNLYALLLLRCDCGMRVWAASSRLYYIIALRRILC